VKGPRTDVDDTLTYAWDGSGTLMKFRIAVGMRITEHPPHRTGRAAFPHPAPTLGV
jgi:hypothetical protein